MTKPAAPDWANSKEREDFLDRAYFEGRMSGRIRPGGHAGTDASFTARSYDPGHVYSTKEDDGDWVADRPTDHGAARGR